jgi:hypothetical protein
MALVAGCGVLSVLGVAAWAVGGPKLVMNGTVASTGVRMIGGKAYVPIADVARALDMSVVPIAGGYEIKKAGGATPIEGLQGKVGDVLFDGKWRFSVLSVDLVDSYTMKHKSTVDYALYNSVADLDDDTLTFTPKAGRALVAIKCRVTNGRNSTQSLWIYNEDTRTALADTAGESHPPFTYDMDESEPFHSKKLLPGAKTDFTVLFSVPEGITLNDLVFTLKTINNNDKGSDARVSLLNLKNFPTVIRYSDR